MSGGVAPIWEFVASFLARPGDAVKELETRLAAESQAGRDHAAVIRRLQKRRQELVTARKRVLSQYGAGVFSDDDIKAEVGVLTRTQRLWITSERDGRT
jgi:hypothetical protein